MVSHQLVYVTGMLEVIFGPFRPLGRLKTGGGAFRGLGRRQGRRPSLPGTRLSSLPRKGPSGTSAKFAGY